VSDESDFVVIGLLKRAHGVKGEICVQPVSDVPERLKGLERVLMRHEGNTKEILVERVRGEGGKFFLKIRGVDDRTAAETLAGAELGVKRKDVYPVPEGTYYVFDLIGCKVVGESERYVGTIRDVLKTPANDVFAVETAAGEILIPMVLSVVKEIDLDNKVVKIEEIEGLLG
jgi:16S rRNA processing protein RimM